MHCRTILNLAEIKCAFFVSTAKRQVNFPPILPAIRYMCFKAIWITSGMVISRWYSFTSIVLPLLCLLCPTPRPYRWCWVGLSSLCQAVLFLASPPLPLYSCRCTATNNTTPEIYTMWYTLSASASSTVVFDKICMTCMWFALCRCLFCAGPSLDVHRVILYALAVDVWPYLGINLLGFVCDTFCLSIVTLPSFYPYAILVMLG